MNGKNAKGLVSIVSTVAIASIILFSLITLLIYTGVIVIKWKITGIEKKWETTEPFMSADEGRTVKLLQEEATIELKFIDENGNNYEMDDNIEEIQPHLNCNHSWQLGTVTKHRIFINRACEYTLCGVSKCSKCGGIRVNNEYEFHKYSVCPH